MENSVDRLLSMTERPGDSAKKQVHSGNRGFRTSLHTHVREFVALFGNCDSHYVIPGKNTGIRSTKDLKTVKRRGDSIGIPIIDDEAVKYIVGWKQTLRISQFINRLELNNLNGANRVYLAARRETGLFGCTYSPEYNTRRGIVPILRKCVHHGIRKLNKKCNKDDLLSAIHIDVFLATVCYQAYKLYLFADVRRTADTVNIISDYVTELMWYVSEIVLYTPPLEVLTISIDIILRRMTYPDLINSMCESASSDMEIRSDSEYTYRWYEKPLLRLLHHLKCLCEISDEENGVVDYAIATELFPIVYRMGYTGRWLMKEDVQDTISVGGCRSLALLNHAECNIHDVHPVAVCNECHDLSPIDCTRTVPRSIRYTHIRYGLAPCTASRRTQKAYNMSRKLIGVISENKLKIQLIECLCRSGLDIVLDILSTHPVTHLIQSYFKQAWMNLNYSSDTSPIAKVSGNTERSDCNLAKLYREWISSKPEISKELEYVWKQEHTVIVEIYTLIHTNTYHLKSHIYALMRSVVQKLLHPQWTIVFESIMCRSKHLREGKYLDTVERLIMEQLTEFISACQCMYFPQLLADLNSKLEYLQTYFTRTSKCLVSTIQSYEFADFMKLSSMEVEGIEHDIFQFSSFTWTSDELIQAMDRCMRLNDANKVNIIRDRATWIMNPEHLYSSLNLSGNFANMLSDDVTPSFKSLINTYQAFICLISYRYVPEVTDVYLDLHYQVLNKIHTNQSAEEHNIHADSNPSMYEVCNSVWETPESWEMLREKDDLRKLITELNVTEYIMFAIESIGHNTTHETAPYRSQMLSRIYYSISQVIHEGNQPHIQFRHSDGIDYSMPEWTSSSILTSDRLDDMEEERGEEEEEEDDDEDEDDDDDDDDVDDDVDDDGEVLTWYSTVGKTKYPEIVCQTGSKDGISISKSKSKSKSESESESEVGFAEVTLDTSTSAKKRHKWTVDTVEAKRSCGISYIQASMAEDTSEAQAQEQSLSDSHEGVNLAVDDMYMYNPDEVAKEVCFLIYPPNNNELIIHQSIGKLSEYCSRRDSVRSDLWKSMILSKVLVRRSYEGLEVCDIMVSDIYKGIHNCSICSQSDSWLWVSTWDNLYKAIRLNMCILLHYVAEATFVMSRAPKDFMSFRCISQMQQVMLYHIFVYGSITEMHNIHNLITMEVYMHSTSGVLYRFLDFLRCYIKPMHASTKLLCIKVWKYLMKYIVEYPKYPIITRMYELDMNRNIIHHVADIGLEEDITIELMEITLRYVKDEQDDFGRTGENIVNTKRRFMVATLSM